MTLPGATLFVVTAILAIAGGLMTIWSRRPLRAAIGLLVHIISLSAMFLTLNAQNKIDIFDAWRLGAHGSSLPGHKFCVALL